MARSKINVLKDDVIAAARTWATECYPDFSAERVLNNNENLRDAVAALDAYCAPITPTPGSYVVGSPETSAAAAIALTPIATEIRKAIVNEVFSVMHYGVPGLSDHQLEQRLRREHQTVSSARNWLCEHGWLVDSGYRTTNPSKRKAVLWALTPKAQDYVKGTA